MKLPEIIGIAGTNGAGKDTLAELCGDLLHYQIASLSDILRRELDKQNKPHTRENLRALSTRWRIQYGAGTLATQTIEQYNKEKDQKGYKGLSIVSLRHPGVVDAIKKAGGLIIWIDGGRTVRFERVRAASRGRIEDEVTFDEFCEQEDAEMYPPKGDTDALDMAGVRELADVRIENNFSTIEEYTHFLIDTFKLR
jgi:dephospho-CoA kinase